jgi:hypothetical protein
MRLSMSFSNLGRCIREASASSTTSAARRDAAARIRRIRRSMDHTTSLAMAGTVKAVLCLSGRIKLVRCGKRSPTTSGCGNWSKNGWIYRWNKSAGSERRGKNTEIDPNNLPKDATTMRCFVSSLPEDRNAQDGRIRQLQHMLEKLLQARHGRRQLRVLLFSFPAPGVQSGARKARKNEVFPRWSFRMRSAGRLGLLASAVAIGWFACNGHGQEATPKTPVPIYVGAWSVDHEFDLVTDECINIIRTKKILFGSRSWGVMIGTYFKRQTDPKYKLEWDSSYTRKRVNETEKVLPADLFTAPKIVNYIFDPVPKRWRYMDDFLRNDPWKFADKVDACFQSIYYIHDVGTIDEDYFPVVDAWTRDFPKLKVAIFTHLISASGMDLRGNEQPEASEWNVRGGDYSEQVIKKYYGKLPIFDMRDIVSTHADGTVCSFVKDSKTYRKLCPEYNINKDLIHPNTPEAIERLGKGFLIFLTKMFCADKIPASRVTPKPDTLK